MDNLLKSLRSHAQWVRNFQAKPKEYIVPVAPAIVFDQAADEIERLQEENWQLKRATSSDQERIAEQDEEIERMRAALLGLVRNRDSVAAYEAALAELGMEDSVAKKERREAAAEIERLRAGLNEALTTIATDDYEAQGAVRPRAAGRCGKGETRP